MRLRSLSLLLLAACAAPAPDTAVGEAPAPAGADWWSTVQGQLDREVTTLRVAPEGALVADLPRAATSVRFDPVGMSADGGLSLSLVEWGRAGALGPVAVGAPDIGGADGTRAVYDRGGAIEWWEVRADGVEVGWDLDRAPDGDGELSFRLAVSGAGIVEDADGVALVEADLQRWDVSDVVAIDATGRGLPAGLRVDRGALVAWVDDSDAVYPITVDPVLTTATSTLSGASSGIYFGYSVAGAGDVNGDGYDDVIVGAYMYNSGAGRAYVYLGSASGVSTSVSTTLGTGTAGGHFGLSVSTAGDITNDGYDDVIVGEEGTNNAWVYWGSSRGVGTSGVQVPSDAGAVNFGRAVAGAGDVNGDGYDDLIVGDSGMSGGKGRVYIFHGRRGGVNTTVATEWDGSTIGMELGAAVAAAGDVNNDGYADVIVGAPSASSGAGAAYVHQGSASGINSSPTTTLGGRAGSAAGSSVSGRCDFNGDGYDDVIIGSPDDSSGDGYAASFAGSASGVGTSNLRAWSAPSGGAFGTSVACLGDTDGDGYGEAVIGAPGVSGGGAVYIYHGTSAGPRSMVGETLTNSSGSAFGTSVAAAGDVNNDGSADVIVGDYGVSSSAGKAYIFHGDLDVDSDGYGTSVDCDDTDPSVHPGATETPGDGVDEDCDGSENCYIDADNDGYRISGVSTVVSADADCSDSGEALASDPATDCDDTRSSVNPGVTETVANSRDDDCDGRESCYDDVDNDGYRTTSTVFSSDLDCTDAGEATSSDPSNDCDDRDADVNPGESEVVGDNKDNNCDGAETCYVDADDDAYRTDATIASADTDCTDPGEGTAANASGDCDDTSPAVHPGATETAADGIDQDCDGTERCYIDRDGDGYRPDGVTTVSSADLDCSDAGESDGTGPAGDCLDTDATVNPGATDAPDDGVDTNCDGVDDCYTDADADGYRTETSSPGNDLDCTDAGEAHASTTSGDCDDRDAAVHPGTTELPADRVDQDCDGTELCYVDADADGVRPDDTSTVVSDDLACDAKGEATSSTRTGDCDDTDPATYPGAEELPGDGIDEDCNGAELCWEDIDADGYHSDEAVRSDDLDCEDAGEVNDSVPGGDCDDANGSVNPAAIEVCDGYDDDCDGTSDGEDAVDAVSWARDADGDGYTDPNDTAAGCEPPEGYRSPSGAADCNDADPGIYPGAAEAPDDGIDNDCDGTTDEVDQVDDTGTVKTDGGGCGCASGGEPAGGVAALVLAGLALRRRRR